MSAPVWHPTGNDETLRPMRGCALLLGLALILSTGGCVYPRRTTSLSPVTRRSGSAALNAPSGVWRLVIVGAHVRPRNNGNLAWDDDEGLPDVFVRVYRRQELILETPTENDTLEPAWDASPENNLFVDDETPLRIEVWDSDLVGADPIGVYDRRGLPAMAIEGADARIMLEGGSWLTVRREPPTAHRGLGVARYEVRPDRLVLLELHTYSPIYRAGLRPGDEVVGVGDRRVADMSDGEAASALSMASSRRETLTYVRRGREESVEVDRGYVWLVD